ncbi:hypothetical protein RF11_09265 [Thelohanellus kitauei]|uniref:Vigilin n=1 Tax=Thelohanellus kitauei TaxID=669202 RepID=A0A0C2MKD1_THEKT|nr:hypothetical protein RF11_09265 [Thelohanellus kitauei]
MNSMKIEERHSKDNMESVMEINDPQPVSAISIVMERAKNPRIIDIPFSDRRYKEDGDDFRKMVQYISNGYNLNVKHHLNTFKNLIIEFRSKGTLSDEQARFIIQETFSVQKKASIKIDEKIFKQLSGDKKFIDSLSQNRCIVTRIDRPARSVVMEGGPTSVAKAAKDVKEYMAWNTDPVKLALDIPNIYQKFIRRQDSSMINNIIDSAGKYVAVELEKPTRDKILLTGNSQCVQKARTLIMAECDRLGNVLTKKTLDLAKSQYLAFMENVSEKIYNCKNVSIVGTKGKNNQYLLEIAGESLIVEEVLKCLETTLHENRATCVKYPYWICKYLSGSEDFENSLVDCFGNVQCEINPYEEAITVFCHHSITDAVLTKIRSFVEDFESQWLYDGLLVSDTVVRDLKDKNSEKLQRIEKETGAEIFIENQLDNLSILEISSKRIEQMLGRRTKSNQHEMWVNF